MVVEHALIQRLQSWWARDLEELREKKAGSVLLVCCPLSFVLLYPSDDNNEGMALEL